jgi:2-methylcitrate dehydratase PrpD
VAEIEKIHVDCFRQMARLGNYTPDTTVAAQYSVPFAIALALWYGRIGPEELTEANLANEDLLKLARRVKLAVDPELDRLFPAKTAARVALRAARGTFTTTVEYPRGNPENPLSDAELGDKFLWLSTEVVGRRRSRELREMIDHLDELDTVRRLADLLKC